MPTAPIWTSLTVSPVYESDGTISYLISQIEDISDRKESEERLTRQALHDSLTGLPNRTLFADRVRMAANRRASLGYAIIYLDLDGFKLVNDTLGHAAGDQVLIEVGRRLERLLRAGDTLARLSGDEFALLCEEVGEEDVRTIADRVIDAISTPIDVQGRTITQAASIGIALYSSDGTPAEPDEMLGDADLAMYRAKAAGKSRYAMFETWMRTGDTDQSALERELREGIANDELTVHYQPEVDLISGEITGAEALVRWQHPKRGLLEPAQFLFVAESSDLIADVDDFCPATGLLPGGALAEELPDGERLTVSVNISERRLSDPGLSGKIAQSIADAKLPAQSLCLEIARYGTQEVSQCRGAQRHSGPGGAGHQAAHRRLRHRNLLVREPQAPAPAECDQDRRLVHRRARALARGLRGLRGHRGARARLGADCHGRGPRARGAAPRAAAAALRSGTGLLLRAPAAA
jgi:diguanylate cyclase (GGDEF)-like protein